MTLPYAYRPPNPPARRAGLLLLILAGAAFLFGGVALIAAFNLNHPALTDNPAMRQQLEELRRQLPFDLKYLYIAYAAVLLLYAAAAATVGVLVRTGGLAVLIVTLVLATAVGFLAGLYVVIALAGGAIGLALLPAVVLALHGLIVAWTIDALRRTSGVTPAAPPAPYRPMQAYYEAAVMPSATTR